MQTAPDQIDRRQSALLHRACRRLAPDIWLAVRFLSRAERDRLLAVGAVLRLLADLVAGREVDGEHEKPNGDGERSHGSKESGGCSCGSDSLEMRVLVAHNVVAFLFDEAKPGSVGRPELEAFIAVLQFVRLPRAAFDAFVDGYSAMLAQHRIATSKAQRRLVDGAARPMAEIVQGVMSEAEPDAAMRSQAVEAAKFVVRAQALLTMRHTFLEEDRCVVPLSELSNFGLRDADLAAWMRGEVEGGAVNGRCAQLMENLRAQSLALLAASVNLIDSLPGAAARALAAYVGLWAEALLVEPLGRAEAKPSLNDRLKSHRFRAWRFAIARRFDPRVLAAIADSTPRATTPLAAADA